MKTPRANNSAKFTATTFKWLTPFALVCIINGCSNNNEAVRQYKTLHEHDSMLMAKTQADDSAINGYIHNMNDIQGTIDEIKKRAIYKVLFFRI